MAVGQCFLGREQILGRDEGFVAQQAAEGLDFLLGPIGEVGQGALAGFVGFGSALAEADGGRGVAVGDGFDVHGSYYAHILTIVKANMLITWAHFHRGKFGLWSNKSETYRIIWPDFFWNFGLEEASRKNHGKPPARRSGAWSGGYCAIWLPTCENTLLALPTISLTVPITITRITASITAYSATS